MGDLKTAVENAIKEQTKTETTEEKIEQPEVKEEVKEETSDEVEEEQEEDQETLQAKQLYEALKNPQTAALAIENLIKVTGYNPNQTVKQNVSTIKDKLTAKLGEEYSFLADRLTPALEEIVADLKNDFKTELTRRDQERAIHEFEQQYNEFFVENPEAKKLEPKMDALAKQILPNNIPVKAYLSQLYKLAQADTPASEAKKVAKTIEKINNNAKDAKNRIASSDVDDARIKSGSYRPSIKEAINLAMQGKSVD